MGISTIDHWQALHMSLSSIDELYTWIYHHCKWVYPPLATTTPEHIHHWPLLHMNISNIDKLCTWTYPPLTSSAHEHIHHWPALHMSISTIDKLWTRAYPPLISSAYEHIHHWSDLHMGISTIDQLTNHYHFHNYTTLIPSISDNIMLTYPQIAPTAHGHQYPLIQLHIILSTTLLPQHHVNTSINCPLRTWSCKPWPNCKISYYHIHHGPLLHMILSTIGPLYCRW